MQGQVLFDLNGTLFDLGGMARPLGGDPDSVALIETALRETITLSMLETITGSFPPFPQMIEASLVAVLGRAGRGDQVAAVLAAAREMDPYPEAAEAIGVLRAGGWRAGVLTNSATEAAEALIDRAGLDLDPIVGTDQIGAYKPDPRVYTRGLEVAGTNPGETVLVSAHWWDALGAKRAGLRSAWVSRKERVRVAAEPAPDFIGEDLLDVAQAIVGSG